MYDPAARVDAGYLDQIVAPDEVEATAIAEAARLAATLHLGPFALTRKYVRGDTGRALDEALAADVGRSWSPRPDPAAPAGLGRRVLDGAPGPRRR